MCGVISHTHPLDLLGSSKKLEKKSASIEHAETNMIYSTSFPRFAGWITMAYPWHLFIEVQVSFAL
jgi:hypothetical protein